MNRIQFTLYWAAAVLTVAAMLVIGTMIGRADAAVYHLAAGGYDITGDMSGGAAVTFEASGNIGLPVVPEGSAALLYYTVSVDGEIPQQLAWLKKIAWWPYDYGNIPRTVSYDLSESQRHFSISLDYEALTYNAYYAIPYVDVYLPDRLAIAAVPEPTTWALMLLGFIGIAGYGSMRNRRAECL